MEGHTILDEVNESVTAESMDHVLYRCTRTKPLDSLCCKSFYQIRKLKNKGALIVLVWNYLISALLYYFASHMPQVQLDHTPYFIVYCFILLLAGWLADSYLGRYKVIRWSMWIMWVGSVLATVSSVVAQMMNSYQHLHTSISLALYKCLFILFCSTYHITLEFTPR